MYIKIINEKGNIEIIDSVEKVIYKQELNKFQIFTTDTMEFYVESYNFIECYQ